MLAPWRLFHVWSCSACGLCCRKYVVQLNKSEVEFYTSLFGKHVVEKISNKIVLRRINNRCIFQRGNLCVIHDYKPIRCKLWPFIVLRKPLNKRTAKLAEFEHLGEIFYIYVDTFCPGFTTGKEPIEKAIQEAIIDYLSYHPARVLEKSSHVLFNQSFLKRVVWRERKYSF